jgi:hypothetical protein
VLFEGLNAELDRLAGIEGRERCDKESLASLHAVLARVEWLCASSAVAAEDCCAAALDGASSVAVWLSKVARISLSEARRELRLGRAMRELQVAGAAFAEGEIGSAQMDVLARLSRGRCGEAMREGGEELLVAKARELAVAQFERVAAYFEQVVDPDGAEDRDEARRGRRELSLSQSLGGSWYGRMTLDPISGEIVSAELSRLEGELYEQDLGEARARLSREPSWSELSRTSAQRRVDALVEMARRSAGADGSSPAPLFSVLVGYETLKGRICELASGTVVSPGSLLSWLSGSLVERVVFRPGRRTEVGARARFFGGATRRAVEVRDRSCAHPFCDRPVDQCDVDHVVPYVAGGLHLGGERQIALPAPQPPRLSRVVPALRGAATGHHRRPAPAERRARRRRAGGSGRR